MKDLQCSKEFRHPLLIWFRGWGGGLLVGMNQICILGRSVMLRPTLWILPIDDATLLYGSPHSPRRQRCVTRFSSFFYTDSIETTFEKCIDHSSTSWPFSVWKNYLVDPLRRYPKDSVVLWENCVRSDPCRRCEIPLAWLGRDFERCEGRTDKPFLQTINWYPSVIDLYPRR